MNELFKKLAEETNRTQISPEIEVRLLKEFRRHRLRGYRRVSFALAACLIAAIWLAPGQFYKTKPISRAHPVYKTNPMPVAATAPPRPRPVYKTKPKPPEPEFLRIPYSSPLDPHERAEIVRVEMPVSAFAAAGIQIATADTGAKAQADVVIGQDGMARAVRVISVSSN